MTYLANQILFKKVDEHVNRVSEAPVPDIDVENTPEGTMFIVKNGKLVTMQTPKANVTSQREASPVKSVLADTQSSAPSSQV